MKILAILVFMSVFAATFTACGDDAVTPTPSQPTRTGTARSVSTAAVGDVTATTVTTSITPDELNATVPGTAPSPAAAATATLAPDRKFELAPIDGAEMVVRESSPPQYAVHVTSGLPSGCAEFGDVAMTRSGEEIAITVRNTLPADTQIACTQIYGMHETTVELGTDFVSGTRYTVRVNDRTLEVTAQ